MDEHKKRLDLNDESGITRRDVLRRGAIVGGTLLWVAPAIQSLAPAARAQITPGQSELHFCCYCRFPNGNTNGQCLNDHVPVSSAECDAFCASVGMVRVEYFGPRATGYTCSFTTGCDPKI